MPLSATATTVVVFVSVTPQLAIGIILLGLMPVTERAKTRARGNVVLVKTILGFCNKSKVPALSTITPSLPRLGRLQRVSVTVVAEARHQLAVFFRETAHVLDLDGAGLHLLFQLHLLLLVGFVHPGSQLGGVHQQPRVLESALAADARAAGA